MADPRVPVIVVIDDTEGNRYAVAHMLRNAGYHVLEGGTGREALRLAKQHPDLIVLDVGLPDIDGLEVARRLREDRETALTPIVHLTASYMTEADRAQGLESGANYYLTHPVDPSVFMAIVRSLLRARRVEEELNAAGREWRATIDAISDAVLVLDHEGTILRANRGAEHLLGESERALAGCALVEALRADLADADVTDLSDAVRSREPVVHELPMRDRWLRIAVDPIPESGSSRATVVCVLSDITERKRGEQERARLLESTELARAEAEAANRAKSDFLATMSHEIRTPINAIMGYAQILDMGIPGSVSEEQRKHLDRLRRSAAHLLGLVNEVLDLAKVEAGRMRIDSERARLDEALDAALAITRPLAHDRGLLIDDDRAARPPLFYLGDEGRVRQILVNLLSNAVKFTEPGGRISVRTDVKKGVDSPMGGRGPWLMVEITDTGIGIDSARLSDVFEPFVQEESGRTRRRGGTGLGLTISRRLARLMGGDLTVSSVVGTGSTFTLWLPSPAEEPETVTAEMAIPTRSAAFDARILRQAGITLRGCVNEVSHDFVVRLRADSALPALGELTDPQLIDHTAAYVADIAQSLIIVAEAAGDASMLLRDGNAIRTVIAERHGFQRAELGWTVPQLEREFELLQEAIEHLLRARSMIGDEVEGVFTLLGRLLEQSRVVSVRALRQASGG
jgi:PAS domain S-box-containing protein